MTEYEKILMERLEKDDRTIIMTAENRGPMRNIVNQLGDRLIDTGITEQTMIGMAAGLAIRGRRPITHALAAFLTMRAFEFIRTDVGIAHLPVKVVGFVPGILSDANGPTHQAIEDVSLMRGIPGMQIFCPTDEQDMSIGLRAVLESDSPCYIRYTGAKASMEHHRSFDLGKAEVISEGTDVMFLTYGALFEQTHKAHMILREQGVSAGILNLRMLNPIDEEAIIQAARKAKLVVTVEDHFLTGGLATITSELFVKNRVLPNVMHIGFDQSWFRPALLSEVLEHEGLTGERIAAKVKRALEEK